MLCGGAEYIPKHIKLSDAQRHAHTEHCTHSCIALAFILLQKGMVLLLNVLCHLCTVKGGLEGPKGKAQRLGSFMSTTAQAFATTKDCALLLPNLTPREGGRVKRTGPSF